MLFGLRQRDHHRQLTVGGQAVALVRLRVFALIKQRVLRQKRRQRTHHFVLPFSIDGVFDDQGHANSVRQSRGVARADMIRCRNPSLESDADVQLSAGRKAFAGKSKPELSRVVNSR